MESRPRVEAGQEVAGPGVERLRDIGDAQIIRVRLTYRRHHFPADIPEKMRWLAKRLSISVA